MQHAADAVGRLAPERRPAVGVAIEPRAPRQQFTDVGGAFLNEAGDRRLVAEAVAGPHGIGRM